MLKTNKFGSPVSSSNKFAPETANLFTVECEFSRWAQAVSAFYRRKMSEFFWNADCGNYSKEVTVMKITRDMKIKEVLAINEEKMLSTLMWLAPEFERLQYAKLRRAMSGRVSVAQAARIAHIPLAEMLYVLNLAAGEPEEKISAELRCTSCAEDFEFHETNPPQKPLELKSVADDAPNVVFLDLMIYADTRRDPMPAIAKGLVSLKRSDDVLLLKHPFDPVPLRDMFARRGFSSWAEERNPGEWFIYFYQPSAAAKAKAYYSINHKHFARAASSIV